MTSGCLFRLVWTCWSGWGRRAALLTVAFMALQIQLAAAAVPTTTVDCKAGASSLLAATGLFQGSAAVTTPQAVVHLPATEFRPLTSGNIVYFGDKARWLKIHLRNPGHRDCERWLEVGPAGLRNVQLYLPDAAGWKRLVSGPDYPLRDWALPVRSPVFPVTIPAMSDLVLVMHIANQGLSARIAPVLWDANHFRDLMARSSLFNGMVYGAMLLLLLASLALGLIHRLPELCYMALGVGFYTIYTVVRDNYLFIYLWPDSPLLNLSMRYFFVGLMFAAANRYICGIVGVARLSRVWPSLFGIARGLFLLVALTGGWLLPPHFAAGLLIGVDLLCRALFCAALLIGWKRATVTGWYPPVLVGLVCLQGVLMLLSREGTVTEDMSGAHWLSTTVLVGGLLLLGTLIGQMRKGRRKELQAHQALDEQLASENARLEKTVSERTAQLSSALAARRQLLARISHDLRAPLAGMVDGIRLWKSGEAHRDYPELLDRYARQQMNMIDELLEFSHIELADLRLEPIPGYLFSFLNDVADQVELAMERHANRLERAFSGDLPAIVWLDFYRLQQVLINLLSNAAKFTSKGVVTFSVQARPAEKEDAVRLRFSITDTGCGMMPADQQRLLLPFQQGNTLYRHQGVGLGLSIVTRLLHLMTSELQIDSTPSVGSCFRFELEVPRGREREIDLVMGDNIPASTSGGGLRVLVVDDDVQQCELLCDMLNSYDFDCQAASNGREALDILQQQAFDVVLTDDQMPVAGGWELLAAIRERHPWLRVVLYSALPPVAPAAFPAGLVFDATLLKPVNSDVLLQTLLRITASSMPSWGT